MDRGIRQAKAYDDGYVVSELSPGNYVVQVPGRPHPYNGIPANKGVGTVQPGTLVRVAKNGRLHEIVGSSAPPSNRWANKGGSGSIPNGIEIPIVPVNTGMWFQTGGFWWEPWATSFFQISIALNPAFTENTETFGPYSATYPATDAGGFGGTDGSDVVFMFPRELPPRFAAFETLQIKIDGVDKTTYYQSGRIFYADNPWQISLNDFSDPIEQPTAPSAVLAIEITYKYLTAVSTTLAAGLPGEGPDKAISPRGIAMFPATSGAASQVAAVLRTTYEAVGGETTIVREEETLSPDTGAFAYSLSFPAIPGSLDYGVTGIDTPSEVYYPAPHDTVYLLAVSAASTNGDISITYQINNPAAGTPVTYTESFVGDGSSAVFTLTSVPFPNTSAVLVYANNYTLLAGDGLASLNTTTGQVTMSYVPGSSDDIEIRFTVSPAATIDQTDTFTPPGMGGQSAFTLSATPISGSTFVVPNYPAYGAFNFDPFATGYVELNPTPLHPLYSGGVVRFALQNNGSDISAFFTYNRERIAGDLFNITGQTIREFNATTNSGIQTLSIPYPVPYDATPLSPFLTFHGANNVSTALGNRWQDGWVKTRWGYLTYDVVTDAYTVVTPVGIFWRSRNVTSVEGVDWTLMPWPAEVNSADKAFAGYSWSVSGESGTVADKNIARRTAPWFGVGVASRFALQGSWAPVGPNLLAPVLAPPDETRMPAGLPSDTDFFLRFFRRNETLHTWQLVRELSVRALVPLVEDPNVYIPGSGLMHLEGNTGSPAYPLGWAAGRPDTGDSRNSWWPATRNGEFWVIAAGWCKADWLVDQFELTDERTLFENYKVGLDDAGLTLNSINNQGEIIDTITFKCSKTIYENGYDSADISVLVDYALSHADDQFNRPASPPTAPGRSYYFGIYTIYAADAGFGYWPFNGVNNYVYFYYSLNSLDSTAPKTPNLQYPGIPALGSGKARVSNDLSGQGSYGTIKNEDNFQSQQISLGTDNTIYLVTSEPTFVRGLDYVASKVSEEVAGEFTFTTDPMSPIVGSNRGPTNYVTYNVTGWEGSPLISSIRDIVTNPGAGNATYWESIGGTAPHRTEWNGNYYPSHNVGGTLTPFVRLANQQVIFPPPDRTEGPFPDGAGGDIYLYYREGTLRTTWLHTIPHRTYCTFRDYIPRGPTADFYYIPGNADSYFHAGAVRFYTEGDHRKSILSGSKTILRKIGITAEGLFDPKWELDVSTFAPVADPVVYGGGTINPIAVSSHRTVFYTIARGRFIFMLRLVPYPVLASPPQTPPSPYKDYLVLEIYENGDVVPTGPKWTVWLPNPGVGDGATATLNPPTAVDLNNYSVPADLAMHVGQSPEGREWVLIAGTRFGGFGSRTPYYFLLKCPTLLTDDPTTFYKNNSDGLPDPSEVIGMAAAGDLYFWVNDDMEIVNRSGG